MSDFRNVLKAGLMVSASLFAVGCSDKNTQETTTPATPGGSTTTPGGSTSTPGGSTSTPVAAVALSNPAMPVDLAAQMTGLKESFQIVGLNNTVKADNKGVLDVSSAVAKDMEKASLNLTSQPTSQILDFKTLSNVGGLFVDAATGNNHQAVVPVVLSAGDLTAQVMNIDDTVIKGTGADRTLTVNGAATVGINAAIGLDTPHVAADGKTAIKFPATGTALALELGANKAAGTGNKGTTKTVTGSSNLQKDKNGAKPSLKTKPTVAAGNTAVKMVVDGSTIKAGWSSKLDKVMHGEHAALSLSGHIADLTTKQAIVSSTNGTPVVFAPIGDNIPKDPVAKVTTKKSSTATKLALELGAATTKAKANAAASTKKAATTKAAGDALAKKTDGKPVVAQHLVKKTSGTHNFLFTITPDFHSEIDKWTVDQNSEWEYITHHALLVHELEMKEDLGLRVWAQDEATLGTGRHTFTHLGADVKDLAAFKNAREQWNPEGKSQEMMGTLTKALNTGNNQPIHLSTIVEENGTDAKEYHHFDSQTPFGMYVMGNDATKIKVAAGKAIRLHGVDLARSDVISEAGVYMIPLIKDFSGQLPNSQSDGKDQFVLAINVNDPEAATIVVTDWAISSNGFNDMMLFVKVEARTAPAGGKLAADIIGARLMGSAAQGGRSVPVAMLDALTARLDPTNVVANAFVNLSAARINQAAQVASLTRNDIGSASVSMGSVDQYNVSFDHNGAKFGFTYTTDGGNAFAAGKGSTALSANVATQLGGLTAVTSFEATADAGKMDLVSASQASYQAGVTLAKAYAAGGLSVVPMLGLGVATASLNDYSAAVPMASGMLGLNIDNASFAATTFHAGVNLALDGFVAEATGVTASLALGVAGFLGSQADAKLHTSEGRSADLHFSGRAAVPYAQFNLGFATGESMNALISTRSAAVSFAVDR